jgi:hypothetical protein
MSNEDIINRLPNKQYCVKIDSFEEFVKVSDKLRILYDYKFDSSRDKYEKILLHCDGFNKSYNSFQNEMLPVIIVNETNIFPHSDNGRIETILYKDFIKFFDKEYIDERKFIEINTFELNLLKMSVENMKKVVSNLSQDLVRFSETDFDNVLNKLTLV